jgi:hypothetical protein
MVACPKQVISEFYGTSTHDVQREGTNVYRGTLIGRLGFGLTLAPGLHVTMADAQAFTKFLFHPSPRTTSAPDDAR